MKVLVETQSGQSFSIFVQASDKADELKWKIQVKMGIPASDHDLYMAGHMDTSEPINMSKIIDKCLIYSKMKPLDSPLKEDTRRKKHAALAKQWVSLYDRLAADLHSIIDQYREWKLKGKTVYRNNINGKRELETEFMKVSYSKIPLATFALYLVPLLDVQPWFDPGLQDPKQPDLLKAAVREWLSHVDHVIQSHPSLMNLKTSLKNRSKDRDINDDGLSAIYLDDEKCAAVAELLTLNKIWPSRMQLALSSTKPESPGSGSAIRRGSLRENVVLRQTDFLFSALDMFLQVLEIGLSKEISSEVSAVAKPAAKTMKALTHLIFDLIDLDGDGHLSQEESLELCKIILGRASLGRLLMNCICENAPHAFISPTTVPVVQTSLILVTPSVLLTFAEGLESISLNLWLQMDFDNDGELTRAEFCEHFPQALWNTILMPLIGKLAEKSAELTESKADVKHTFLAPLKMSEIQAKTQRNCSSRDHQHCGFSRNCSFLPEHLFPEPPTNKHVMVGPSAKFPESEHLYLEFTESEHLYLDPSTNKRVGLGSSAELSKELAHTKVLFSPDEEGYLERENLNVDEVGLKGSSKWSCKASCKNGMPKRGCLPNQSHNCALGQPCSDQVNASCEKATERKNAACNVM